MDLSFLVQYLVYSVLLCCCTVTFFRYFFYMVVGQAKKNNVEISKKKTGTQKNTKFLEKSKKSTGRFNLQEIETQKQTAKLRGGTYLVHV